MRETLD
jgi:hypothetical protein